MEVLSLGNSLMKLCGKGHFNKEKVFLAAVDDTTQGLCIPLKYFFANCHTQLSDSKEGARLMVRPVYSHELIDPDFAWLLSTFAEEHPGYIVIENPGSPVVMVNLSSEKTETISLTEPFVPDVLPKEK